MGAVSWLRDRASELVDAHLGTEFRERTRALVVQQNEYGFDPFGLSRESLKYAALVAEFLYRRYFRCEVFGIENVPAGRVLLVGNHSGQLPFDALCLVAALMLDGKPPRIVRSMVEKFVPSMPWLSYLLTRWGQITGNPDNCRRLLEAEEAILVFPEGARGISKPFSRRYQLEDFGLGFMRLALQARTPIVPIAVIGAEEQAPSFNVRTLARAIGVPAFPVMPLPPFFPILPLPVRYSLWFGEPLRLEGDPDDDEVVLDHVRTVRNTIGSMIQVGLKERKHVFW
jgi:1-acyl-sn-glycerol-3-phosphate acyltransferase